MPPQEFRSFAEFWPFYVREHAHRKNRLMHTIGTSGVLIFAAAAICTGNWWLLLMLPFSGYGFAWYGHFYIQRNTPATFTHPFWSLLGDFKMYGLTMTGRMQSEVERVLRGGR